jgi:ubiquitin-activating enzyme E1
VTQHKQAKEAKHRCLTDCLTQPGEFLLSDFSKIERPQLLHVAFQALGQFKVVNGRSPRPGNRADIDTFKALCETLNSSLVCPLCC